MYRTHDVSIVLTAWQEVPGLVKALVADAAKWVEFETYPPDESAVRFHHRLVLIHPFVNGNGRHGRFSADYLIAALGQPTFSWGAGLGVDRVELRKRYRTALQHMDYDADDVCQLHFARS